MELLEEILGVYSVSLYREGKRLVELKTLTFLLRIIRGLRELAFIYYLSVVSFVVLTAGVYMLVIQSVNQFQNTGRLYFDPVVIFGAILALSSLSLSIWILNEKRWLVAFHLDDYVQKPLQEKAPVNSEELRALIDEIITKKMKESLASG